MDQAKQGMTNFIKRTILFGGLLAVFAAMAVGQVKRAAFDVTNYTIDVTLSPEERRLTATVDVAFTPLEDTRSVSFELNGSLKIDSIFLTSAGSPRRTIVSPRTVMAVSNLFSMS